MATKPQSNLPPQSQPWARTIEESIAALERSNSINGQNSNNNLRQLNSSVQLLSQSIDQLNHAVESKDASLYYIPSSTPSSQLEYNLADVATVTFTAPPWALSATFMAFSTFSGADSPNSGYGVDVYTRIAQQYSGGTFVGVPNTLPVWSGGFPTGSYAYDTTPAPTVVPFTKKISVNGGQNYSAACAITKAFSGGNSSFAVTITATVFWSAIA